MLNALTWSGIAIGLVGLVVAWASSRLRHASKEISTYLGTVAATFAGVVLAAGLTAYQSDVENRQAMLAVFKAAKVEADINAGRIRLELDDSVRESRDISYDFRKQIPSLALHVGSLTTSSEATLNGISEEMRGVLIVSVNASQNAHVRVIDENVLGGDLRRALQRYEAELDHFRELLTVEIARQEQSLAPNEVSTRIGESQKKRRLRIFPGVQLE